MLIAMRAGACWGCVMRRATRYVSHFRGLYLYIVVISVIIEWWLESSYLLIFLSPSITSYSSTRISHNHNTNILAHFNPPNSIHNTNILAHFNPPNSLHWPGQGRHWLLQTCFGMRSLQFGGPTSTGYELCEWAGLCGCAWNAATVGIAQPSIPRTHARGWRVREWMIFDL